VRLRRTSLITLLICLGVWTLGFDAFDQVALCQSPSSEIIDFIRAENADTISIAEKVAFISPTGEEITPSPGTYRVTSTGSSALRLVPFGGEDLVITAQSRGHDEDISAPVALIAVDEEYLVHVVLLLPGQKGLEAIGFSSRGRHRGSPQLLTPEQIHDALRQKNERRPAP
jgi:hypothetical protein